MRNKLLAAFLALFLGTFGVHRFYLGQIGLGILYAMLFATGISAILGVIDFIRLILMPDEVFNVRYNRSNYKKWEANRKAYEHSRQQKRKEPVYMPATNKQPAPETKNDISQVAIQHFRNFDLDKAIAGFEKVQQLAPKDVPNLFNLACAYALNEDADRAFACLDQAVALGLNDTQRLKTHDALAFLRTDNRWPRFEGNGFRLPQGEDHSSLLEQLNRLYELRQRGLITPENYEIEAAKLQRKNR